MSAPAFLNKPKHKDNVIATSRGWVVEKTGELLVSVKNLDKRIAEHLGLTTFNFEAPVVVADAPVIQVNDTVADEQKDPLAVNVDLNQLLDGLDTISGTEAPAAPKVEEAPVVAPTVAEVTPAVTEATVVVKKKLGRPPKIRPVEPAPAPEPAPVVEAPAVVEEPKADEAKPEEATAVLEA